MAGRSNWPDLHSTKVPVFTSSLVMEREEEITRCLIIICQREAATHQWPFLTRPTRIFYCVFLFFSVQWRQLLSLRRSSLSSIYIHRPGHNTTEAGLSGAGRDGMQGGANCQEI